ncbi:MAG TPA: hypothetical protein VIT43_01525 [Candidatus Dormibacteraeota bacterium]
MTITNLLTAGKARRTNSRYYKSIGGGYGGYNEDHEFFGYRQSI